MMANMHDASIQWLRITKTEIMNTNEWKEVTKDLFQAIQHQLIESRVMFFTDLSDPEKALFMDRAEKMVRTGESYQRMTSVASRLIDINLNENVEMTLRDPVDMIKKSKTDLILERSAAGATRLLARWPDQRRQLRCCINHILPDDLRQEVWVLFLRDPQKSKEYLSLVQTHRLDTVSGRDLDITQRCEALLSSEETFVGHIKTGDLGVLTTMKTVLSYRHAKYGELNDSEFRMLVPFLKVFSNYLYEFHEMDTEVVAILIEHFFCLLDMIPTYIKKPYDSDIAMAQGNWLVETLKKQDSSLLDALDFALQTGVKVKQPLWQGLWSLLTTCAAHLFVGHLSLDVVCYIWDQFLIGSDESEFHPLRYYFVVMLILLRGWITKCTSRPAVERVLNDHASKLTIKQFQQEINERFLSLIQNTLSHELHGGDMPIMDPVTSINDLPPWTYWDKDEMPSRLRPEDRRRIHAEREAKEREQRAYDSKIRARQRRIDAAKKSEDAARKAEIEKRIAIEKAQEKAAAEERWKAQVQRQKEEEEKHRMEEARLAAQRADIQKARQRKEEEFEQRQAQILKDERNEVNDVRNIAAVFSQSNDDNNEGEGFNDYLIEDAQQDSRSNSTKSPEFEHTNPIPDDDNTVSDQLGHDDNKDENEPNDEIGEVMSSPDRLASKLSSQEVIDELAIILGKVMSGVNLLAGTVAPDKPTLDTRMSSHIQSYRSDLALACCDLYGSVEDAPLNFSKGDNSRIASSILKIRIERKKENVPS